MWKSILLASLFLVQSFGFAQTDFRKGYIITNPSITNPSDTLFGLVDYREGAKVYQSCNFKNPKTQNITTYIPGQIEGYGFVDGNFFESKKNKNTAVMADTIVFFEQIIKGRVSLYKLKQTFWVEKDGSDLQQLINKTKETYVNGVRIFKNTNQHISTLNMLLFDCAEMRSGNKEVRLSEKSLTKLIGEYNKCKGASVVVHQAKKNWIKSSIGIAAGVNISQLSFDVEFPGYEHLRGTFETSTSPALGLSLDIISPRVSERISFHGDIFYMVTKYHRYSQYEIPDYRTVFVKNDVSIEVKQLKVPLGFRYTFPERKFTSYFNVGVSATFHLSAKSTWTKEVESFDVVRSYNNEALTIKSNQLGFWGGIGVLKSVNSKLKASLELRYEQTNGIAVYSIGSADLKSQIANFQIVLGLRTK